jgi:hypothetical protein
MTPEEILALIYQLRTHPFAPSLGFDGLPLQNPFAQALDPNTESRHLGYYVDVYDWKRSTQVGPLCEKRALQRFPAPEDLQTYGSLLTIIAGPEHAGRESLRNLLLYAIGTQARPPLVIDFVIEGRDRAQVVKQVAELFMLQYTTQFQAPTYDSLQKAFQALTKTKAPGQDSYYANLFQLWQSQIRGVCDRPLVLSIFGTPDYNTWRVLYQSTRALFKYIFVSTGDIASAETCCDAIKDGNAAVIVATKLTRRTAVDYVRSRINKERFAGAPISLEPFTDQSISALFQRGPTATGDVVLRIGYIHGAMRRALDDHLQKLSQTLRGKPATRASLSAEELEIDADAVRRACNSMNGGMSA